MSDNLNGKSVLVTGAARGIGAAIAEQFIDSGCIVYIADVDLAGAHKCAERLGNNAKPVNMDVADRLEVQSVLQQIQKQSGGLDVLVNNAGIMTTGPAVGMPDESWDRLISVNLTGIYNCIQSVAPIMIAQKSGAIINISSISAFKGGGTFGNVWYGATKAAVVALTKGLARELGPHGVRVAGIAPSVVGTEMVTKTLSAEERAEVSRKFPLGRLAMASDIGKAAVFLASDNAAFITGETIAVDGGLSKV